MSRESLLVNLFYEHVNILKTSRTHFLPVNRASSVETVFIYLFFSHEITLLIYIILSFQMYDHITWPIGLQ